VPLLGKLSVPGSHRRRSFCVTRGRVNSQGKTVVNSGSLINLGTKIKLIKLSLSIFFLASCAPLLQTNWSELGHLCHVIAARIVIGA